MSNRTSDPKLTELAAGIAGGAIALVALVVGWLLGRARPTSSVGESENDSLVPWDDEPLTLDEALHIQANMAEGGELIAWDEVKAKVEAHTA